MRVNYPATSPYAITPQASWHIGRYKHISIRPADDDTLFVITPEYQYRPDRLAAKLYGSDSFWWVFMSRNLNVIRDPIWDFVTGASIIVPSAETVKGATGKR